MLYMLNSSTYQQLDRGVLTWKRNVPISIASSMQGVMSTTIKFQSQLTQMATSTTWDPRAGEKIPLGRTQITQPRETANQAMYNHIRTAIAHPASRCVFQISLYAAYTLPTIVREIPLPITPAMRTFLRPQRSIKRIAGTVETKFIIPTTPVESRWRECPPNPNIWNI